MKKNIQPIVEFDDAVITSKPYWYLVLASWMIGLIYLLINGTYQAFMNLAGIHNEQLDVFFTYFTNLGDGLVAIAVGLFFLLFGRRRIFFVIVFSFLLSGLVVQIIKKIAPNMRPSLYFSEIAGMEIHTLEITTWRSSSYPSGHTATTFALLTCLLLFFPKSKWNVLWILLSFLVGYSRVYIASHFLDDVLAGVVIGVLCAMICYIISVNIF